MTAANPAAPLVPDPATLAACEAVLGHRFRDRDLLVAALTHASTKVTTGRCNERLEFLGDAILGQIVAAILYREHPECDEGRLSRGRAAVVSRRALARVGHALGLDRFVVVGRMFADRAQIADSVLSNAVEAVLAAIWLDAGAAAAEAFVEAHVRPAITLAMSEPAGRDFKTQLGVWAQTGGNGGHGQNVQYVELSTAGADHLRTFEMCAAIAKRRFRPGFGRSKKEAEQRAAFHAMTELGLL